MQEATSNHGPEEGADGLALRRLCDRSAVEELLLRYAMSVDLRDWELFRSCFGDRVRVRCEPPTADVPDGPVTPDEWAALAGRALGPARAGQHYYSIFPVRLEDDEAETVMYYRAGAGDAFDAPASEHRAYLTHRCRRTRSGWKIAEISLHVLPEHSDAAPESGEGPGRAGRGHGGPRRETGDAKRAKRSAAKRR
jgi:hypothetical protein